MPTATRSRSIPPEKLADVVTGRDTAHSRSEAMAVLAASRLPRKEAILGEVLENGREQVVWRTAAATVLGRIATPAAEKILRGSLGTTELPILRQVLKSLGRVGGAGAVGAIDAVAFPAARSAAAWATALISYRLGLPGHDLKPPPAKDLLEVTGNKPLRIDFDAADARLAHTVVEALHRFPYGGVDLEPAHATRIRCSGEINVVCVNAAFRAGPAKLLERKALYAVVALQSLETGDYSPSYLVLSRPARDAGKLDVLVTRCSGTLALAGTAQVTPDGKARFELRSVRRPGAHAILLRGTVEGTLVHMAEALTTQAHEPRRRVERLEPRRTVS